MIVYTDTNSKEKQNALKCLFPDKIIKILDNITSDVPEQPFNQEVKNGALNRLSQIMKLINHENFIAISMESGLFEKNDGNYHETTYIAIKFNINGETFQTVISTERVPILNCFINLVEIVKTDQTKTFGSLLEEQEKWKKNTWQKYTHGRSRGQMIFNTLFDYLEYNHHNLGQCKYRLFYEEVWM